MLDYVGLIPLFPAIGFALNLFFGRRMAKGAVGFIACAAIGLSFLVSLLVFFDLLQDGAGQPFRRKDPLSMDPFRRVSGERGLPGRPPFHRHDDGRFRGLLRHPHLFPRLHARRSGTSPATSPTSTSSSSSCSSWFRPTIFSSCSSAGKGWGSVLIS